MLPSARSEVFTVAERGRVRARVLEWAHADSRVIAGAEVGASALGGGDRWSDLDLTFGVVDDIPVTGVLAEWTERLADEYDAVMLFDLQADPALYRVFLLPGCLQLDLSFAPAARFGATGPNFALLFGSATEHPPSPPASGEELFGLAVHHLVRARFCIERERFWQAEVWISLARDHALERACLARGLEHAYGRGFDRLPSEVLAAFNGALVRSLDRQELLRTLRVTVCGLLEEIGDVGETAARLEPRLKELVA